MKTVPIQSHIYVWSLPDYESINKGILVSMESRTPTPFKNEDQSLMDQDWYEYNWKGGLAPYYAVLNPHITMCLKELSDTNYEVNYGRPLVVINHWFQKYARGDFHSWHHHPATTYSSVYYVQLPEGSETEFKDANGDLIKVKVKEGDFVVFPGHISHQSPISLSQKSTKTIISMNLSADEGLVK